MTLVAPMVVSVRLLAAGRDEVPGERDGETGVRDAGAAILAGDDASVPCPAGDSSERGDGSRERRVDGRDAARPFRHRWCQCSHYCNR